MAQIAPPQQTEPVNKFDALIRSVSMRGVEFKYMRSGPDGFLRNIVWVSMRVPDVDNEKNMTDVGVALRFSDEEFNEKSMLEKIRYMVHQLYLHEADELLMVNGTAPFNPHRPPVKL